MKTKQIIRLAVLMTMAIFLEACCMFSDDTYRNLSKDAINIWEIGDTLIYTSNLGNADTFVVATTSFRYECESNEDLCSTETCYQEQGMRLDQYRYENIHDSSIFIYNNWSTNIKRGGNFDFKGRGWGLRENLYMFEKYEIDNIEYKNIFRLPGHTLIPKKFNYIFYNKTHGVLQYQLVSGEVWTLQSTKD